MRTLFCLIAAAICAMPLKAGSYVRILLPIHDVVGITGVGGVQWSTGLVILNSSDRDIIVGPCGPGFPENPDMPCVPSYIRYPAGSVVSNPKAGWTQAGLRGRLVWVRAEDASALSYSLTLLRDDVPAARLPVPRDDDFATTVHLLRVRVSPDARLRIYGLANSAAAVRLRILPSPELLRIVAVRPLHETTLTLEPSRYVDPSNLPYAPSYAELLLPSLNVPDAEVTLELTSVTDEKIWAFVTATLDGVVDVIQPQ